MVLDVVGSNPTSRPKKCSIASQISTGFNGLARRIYDDERLLADAEEKLKVICHAEANAIFNAARMGVALHSASIFVTEFPCLSCCNAIIQAGITRIYTHDNRYWDDDPLDSDHHHKRAVLKQAGLRVDAPFHPEYIPSQPITLKQPRKAPARSTEVARPTESEVEARIEEDRSGTA